MPRYFGHEKKFKRKRVAISEEHLGRARYQSRLHSDHLTESGTYDINWKQRVTEGNRKMNFRYDLEAKN